jgi:hypothetical protein
MTGILQTPLWSGLAARTEPLYLDMPHAGSYNSLCAWARYVGPGVAL